MYCSDCGKNIEVSMQFCPFCGLKNKLFEVKVVDGVQKTNNDSDSFTNSSSNYEKANENESILESDSFEDVEISDYVGVHGWLKFLVICLTILSPLSNMKSVIESINLLNIAYTFSILMWLIIDVAIIIWSFITGVMLWKISKNAKNNALAFFNFQILISIAVLFIYLSSTDYYSLLTSVTSIISGLIWFGYIKKSKRVSATYR